MIFDKLFNVLHLDDYESPNTDETTYCENAKESTDHCSEQLSELKEQINDANIAVSSRKQDIRKLRECTSQLIDMIDCLTFSLMSMKEEEVNLSSSILRLRKEEQEVRDSVSSINEEMKVTLGTMNDEISKLYTSINEKKCELADLERESLLLECGLYEPQHDFASALDYKEELEKIRYEQKILIQSKNAVEGDSGWTVNGSSVKGRKMVSDTQKLLLRAFNSECDILVSKIKYTNFDSSLERMYKSAKNIEKLGEVMKISISKDFLSAKAKELRLAFEYQQKKQEEKEELRLARAEQREQDRAQRELEEQKKKIEKEQTHYQTVYSKISAQLLTDPLNEDLITKKQDIESHLSNLNKALIDIDYRQANARAGYVYVISNIGAFGENVFKIGMTRRLTPQDRVDELGDASVPFRFDVHAMIFSDDAPALESALHKAFSNRKINMVNQRREFFRVSLDEIKEVVKENFDKTVEFVDVPEAEQYRISEEMRRKLSY